MANYNQNNDKYTEDIRKVEPTDPAHADLINELAQAIINNIAFNKRCINEHINSDNPHEIDADTVGLGKANNTADLEKPVSKAQQDAIDKAYYNSNLYTDQKIADLVNGAPTTLDTIGELAEAFENNKTVVEALNQAIGLKANEKEFNSHTENKNNPHGVTAAQVGALTPTGDTKSNKVTFTSNDVADANAASWTSVTALNSGITHATFFQRVSQMFKNVRYLYKMLGTTDISKIGNGTVRGAISQLNSDLGNLSNTILAKIPIPSFSNYQEKVGGKATRNNLTYTIEKDGWYEAHCQAETTENGDMRISVNGINVTQTYSTHQWTKINTGIMYLKKGAIINYYSNNNLSIACFLGNFN